MTGDSTEIRFQPSLQEAVVSSSGMGRLDGFEEAVMACDITEPCKFPSLDSWQRILWTHRKVDLSLHPVGGIVLQVGDTEKFPHALGFESLDPFSESASRVHVSLP